MARVVRVQGRLSAPDPECPFGQATVSGGKGFRMRIVVYDAGQCDPRKCTARRLRRFGKVELVSSLRELPRGAVLLDPRAEKALSREDGEAAERRGLAALDCSWKRLGELVFPRGLVP
jgi:ribosome biogenesis protein Tsr3